MKVILLGANGQLGKSFKFFLRQKNLDLIAVDSATLDISDNEKVSSFIKLSKPDIIINAAAYTAVDRAESEKSLSNIVNHLALRNLSKICYENKIFLVHFSTDYVFNGKSKIPYVESDKTDPINTYGKTKLDGENSIRLSGCRHIIFRTSWVFSPFGNNFMTTILKLAKKNDVIKIIDDQFGTPTYALHIARSITDNLEIFIESNKSSIYHLAGDIECSWKEFAEEIVSAYADYSTQRIKKPKIIGISSSEYKTKALRPTYSVMNCNQIYKDFGIQASNWKEGIRDVFERELHN